MGVDGALAQHPDEIKPALEKAFSANRPFVLEVVTEGAVSP
jgi:thiamine pyrophosphate-dependent acetolactate synthase large subunit-like protein